MEKIEMFSRVMYVGDKYYSDFYKRYIEKGQIGYVIDIYHGNMYEIDLMINDTDSIQLSMKGEDLKIL